jgi:hypothetical protein
VLETAHSLLPISAAKRPPAVEACFLPRSFLPDDSNSGDCGLKFAKRRPLQQKSRDSENRN